MASQRDDLVALGSLWPVDELRVERELCEDGDRLGAIADAALAIGDGPDDATVRRMARATAAVNDPELRADLARALAGLDEALQRVLDVTAPGARVAGWGRRLSEVLEVSNGRS